MAFFSPVKDRIEKYRLFMKDNRRLGQRISTGLMIAGFAGLVVVGATVPGVLAVGPLAWAAIGVSMASFMGGLHMKATLSDIFVAEEAKKKAARAVKTLQPAMEKIPGPKRAMASLARAARVFSPKDVTPEPPAQNDNDTPAAPNRKPGGLKK